MTTFTRADVWLLLALAWSVVIGHGLWEWLDARRSARRLAAAELAFWQALMRVADGAETPARAVGEIRSVRAMRKDMAVAADAAADLDNEWKRVSGA